MPLSVPLLTEFEQEAATTRRVLQRLSDEHLDWRPHSKSWTAGELLSHLANVPSWMALTLRGDAFDVAPPGAPPPRTTQVASVAEALRRFDENVASGQAALREASDATFAGSWSLLAGGKPLFTLPRAAVVRSFVLSHLIHHRGQLSVYLRLLDLPVPSIYGPSADDMGPLG